MLKLTPEMNPSIFNLLKRDYDAVILGDRSASGASPTTATTAAPSSDGWTRGARWS